MELGAEGILFPQIQNFEEAKQAISFMRYPPDGVRGVAYMFRAAEFGQKFENYYSGYKDKILGIIQIETLGSLDHLDEIANLDGVDVLFVGPSDLTQSLGIFRQFDHPEYIDALKRVNKAASKAGKACGVLMPDPGEYEKYYQLGYRMLGCGSDSVFLSKGAVNIAGELNNRRETAINK
jgi:4-hydroxy-2-oxoheptanedioate aldolase